MHYDKKMREKICELVGEGRTLVGAFLEARTSSTLRDLYIVTPLALGDSSQEGTFDISGGGGSSSKRDRKRSRDRPRKHKNDKGSKGGKSGKGGKDKKRVKTMANGKPICFKFNNVGEKCEGACGMLHVCQLCLSPDHPRHQCEA